MIVYNYVYFTEEQMKKLKANTYVQAVSKSTITYPPEFREEFFKEYSNGFPPSIILRNMGFDTKVLGKERV